MTTRNLLLSAAALGVCFSSVCLPEVFGQEQKKRYRTVEKWQSQVVGYGGRIDKVLGTFDTYSEAEACSRKWSKQNPKDLRLTREIKVKFRVYPPGKGPKREKSNRLNGTGKVLKPGSGESRQQDLEKKIRELEKSLARAERLGLSVASRFRRELERLKKERDALLKQRSPQEGKPRVPSVSGTTWIGTDKHRTVTAFLPNNLLRVGFGRHRRYGTWKQTGNQLSFQYKSPAGRATLNIKISGTISGKRFQGGIKIDVTGGTVRFKSKPTKVTMYRR